jgi:membrane-associated phospholipid phosphatase
MLTTVAPSLIAALLFAPGGAAAQDPKPTPPPAAQTPATPAPGEGPTRSFLSALLHNLGDDLKHMPRKNTLYWLAAGSGLALAVHPEDNTLNRRLRGSDVADALFTPGKYVGSLPVLVATATTTYLVGRAKHSRRGQHLGMDLLEATILADGIAQLIKVSVRRERPLREDGTRSSGFAFPSGHAAGTFAAATVLQQHLGWKAAVPTYTIATYAAISRLHDERHFASDVAFGAAEGIIVGRSVTWHGRNFYASPMFLPKGAGIVVHVNP